MLQVLEMRTRVSALEQLQFHHERHAVARSGIARMPAPSFLDRAALHMRAWSESLAFPHDRRSPRAHVPGRIRLSVQLDQRVADASRSCYRSWRPVPCGVTQPPSCESTLAPHSSRSCSEDVQYAGRPELPRPGPSFYYQLPPHIAARRATGHTSPKANALTGAIPIAPSRSIRRQACLALTNLRP